MRSPGGVLLSGPRAQHLGAAGGDVPRILVVDDSPTILKVVSAILARTGFESVIARDGLIALKLLAEGALCELILLDFVMPRMNGYQFCRALRNDEKTKALPVVLMSAKGDRIRAQFVQQTGAVDAITKPFDARALVAVVEGVLAKVKAGRGPALPTGDAMPDEESLGDASDEPRPSVLPRQLEHRAIVHIIKHVSAVVTPTLLELKESERTTEGLDRAIARALEASPLDALMLSLREATSASTREVLSGDLTFVPLPEVLQMLQMQRQTGVMRVVSGARALTLYLRDGVLDLACSTGQKSELRLGRYFVEMGVLERAEVESAVARATTSGVRLGDELVASAKVSEDARRAALVKQSSELVYDVVRWPQGRFWFARDPHSAEAQRARLSLGIAHLVLEGFRRVDEWREMEGTIKWEEIVAIDEAALQQVGETITRAERMLLGVVDGKRSVNQIVADSELTRFDALKILYHFLSSRVLRAKRPTGLFEVSARPVEEFSTTEGSSE